MKSYRAVIRDVIVDDTVDDIVLQPTSAKIEISYIFPLRYAIID